MKNRMEKKVKKNILVKYKFIYSIYFKFRTMSLRL